MTEQFDDVAANLNLTDDGCSAEVVEIRIDEGPWRVCRRWFGHWWRRWQGAGPGRVEARARMRTKDGLVEAAVPLRFRV